MVRCASMYTIRSRTCSCRSCSRASFSASAACAALSLLLYSFWFASRVSFRLLRNSRSSPTFATLLLSSVNFRSSCCRFLSFSFVAAAAACLAAASCSAAAFAAATCC
eukprot:GHUV01019953.1.p2 GENE.GHUV01019953.1~~GHUV01019953.1.p2  ORF type:complete len:108 (-),score=21.34 GHUV01019953.1:477-800(-)